MVPSLIDIWSYRSNDSSEGQLVIVGTPLRRSTFAALSEECWHPGYMLEFSRDSFWKLCSKRVWIAFGMVAFEICSDVAVWDNYGSYGQLILHQKKRQLFRYLETLRYSYEHDRTLESQRTSWMNPGKSHTWTENIPCMVKDLHGKLHVAVRPKPGQIDGVRHFDLCFKRTCFTWTSPPSSCFITFCFIYLWLFKCLFSFMSFHFHLSEFPLR